MSKWTRVSRAVGAVVLLASACRGGVADTYLLAGVVQNTQTRPAGATPRPDIPRELRTTGALLMRADALPPEVEPCAFPARQPGRRVLVYWTDDTSFVPASLETKLEKTHVSIRGHVVRRNQNVRACSLFADSIAVAGATPKP